jgi:hypothetical protein
VLFVLSAAAAAIHFVAVREHLEEDRLAALFFLVLGAAQLAWALLLRARPTPTLLVVGAVGSLAVVAIWALSRTTGLPFGAHPGMPEPVGLMDATCSALEGLIAAGCAGLLVGRIPARVPAAPVCAYILIATLIVAWTPDARPIAAASLVLALVARPLVAHGFAPRLGRRPASRRVRHEEIRLAARVVAPLGRRAPTPVRTRG